MTSLPLKEARQVTLNGSGNGSIVLGPTSPFQVWKPTQLSVAVEAGASILVATFNLYDGNGVNIGTYGGTFNGNQNSTALSDVTLYPGQTLYGVWTGGPPGVIASMQITGTMEVP